VTRLPLAPTSSGRPCAHALQLAGARIPRRLDALLAVTTLEHLYFRSHAPFTPDIVVAMIAGQLDEAASMSAVNREESAVFPTVADRKRGKLLLRGTRPTGYTADFGDKRVRMAR